MVVKRNKFYKFKIGYENVWKKYVSENSVFNKYKYVTILKFSIGTTNNKFYYD